MNLPILNNTKSDISDNYLIRIVLGSLFALMIADAVITKYLVSKGLAIEVNIFLKDMVNTDAFYFFKVCGALLAITYLLSVYKRDPKLSVRISSIILIINFIVICWNLSSLLPIFS